MRITANDVPAEEPLDSFARPDDLRIFCLKAPFGFIGERQTSHLPEYRYLLGSNIRKKQHKVRHALHAVFADPIALLKSASKRPVFRFVYPFWLPLLIFVSDLCF